MIYENFEKFKENVAVGDKIRLLCKDIYIEEIKDVLVVTYISNIKIEAACNSKYSYFCISKGTFKNYWVEIINKEKENVKEEEVKLYHTVVVVDKGIIFNEFIVADSDQEARTLATIKSGLKAEKVSVARIFVRQF